MTGEKREQHIKTMANHLIDIASVFEPSCNMRKKGCPMPRSGCSATLLYLLTKALYVINICLQIVILNHFLGENYLHWGYEVSSNIFHGKEWKETAIFPRVIMCDFERNIDRHEMKRFVHECLKPDGLLLLQFVREHAGGRIAFDLSDKLLEIYIGRNSFSKKSIKQPMSPMEKYSRPPQFHGFLRQSLNQVFVEKIY
ncbi:Innexin [Dictyocaulus viviparus]|uniref:Innexin n=1 Tax=Dictyocaulus viviparus TaxID=29172 RepID=A0A0D8X7B6_DICVI|nr:Innexin [Dictyocaulus viviparus]